MRTSKFLGTGQPAEKSSEARVLICSMAPVNCRSGMASSCTVTGCFTAKRPRSVSSTRADTRRDDASGISAMGAPGQTVSPTLKGDGPSTCQAGTSLIMPADGACKVIFDKARSAR